MAVNWMHYHRNLHRDLQASTCSPCFWTMESSLSAIPLGRLAPVSHFSMVDSLVFK